MSIRKKLAEKKTKLSAPRERLEDHPVRLHDYKDGDFYNVDLDMILPSPNQPRKYFDPVSLNELSQSIKQKGVLQPVIIRKGDNNKFYLVAGERRNPQANAHAPSPINANCHVECTSIQPN